VGVVETRLRVGLVGAGLVRPGCARGTSCGMSRIGSSWWRWPTPRGAGAQCRRCPLRHPRAARVDRGPDRSRPRRGRGRRYPTPTTPTWCARPSTPACTCSARSRSRCRSPECDRIAAARDAAGRVVQVGTMKRFDPAYLRLLELLPDTASDVRYLSVEVRDPDQGPFVDHLPMIVGRDLDPALGNELRERTDAAVRRASDGEPAPGGARAFEGYLSGDGARRQPAAGHPRASRRALARARRRRRVVGRGPARSRSRRPSRAAVARTSCTTTFPA